MVLKKALMAISSLLSYANAQEDDQGGLEERVYHSGVNFFVVGDFGWV